MQKKSVRVNNGSETILDAQNVVVDCVQVRALDEGTDGDGGWHDDAVRVQT